MKKGFLLLLAASLIGGKSYASNLYQAGAYIVPNSVGNITAVEKSEIDKLKNLADSKNADCKSVFKLAQLYLKDYNNTLAFDVCYNYILDNIDDETKLSDIRKVINNEIKTNRDKDFYLTLEGVIFLRQYDSEKALPVLKEALTLNPNNVNAKLYYGKAIQYSGDSTAALKIFEMLLAQKPTLKNVRVFIAEVLRDFGRNDESIAYYKDAMAHGDNFDVSIEGKMYSILEQKMTPSEAIVEIYPELQYRKITSDDMLVLAEKVSWTGEHDSAIKLYQNIIASDARCYKAYWHLTDLYMDKEDKLLARQVIEQARKAYANDPEKRAEFSARIADCVQDPASVAEEFYNQGEYYDAISLFERSDYLSEQQVYKLAQSQDKTNQAGPAIDTYERLIAMNSNNPEYFYNLAILYDKKEDFDRSLELYQNALALAPNYSDTNKKIADLLVHKENTMLKEAFLALRSDDYGRTQDLVDSVLNINNNSSHAYLCRAILKEKKGDIAGQLVDLKYAYEKNSKDKDICFNLATYYDTSSKSHSPELAVKYYKEFLILQKDETDSNVTRAKERVDKLTGQSALIENL